MDRVDRIHAEGGMAKEMTLRDYFAAKCLNRLIYIDIGENLARDDVMEVSQTWAAKAYIIADAMLECRHKNAELAKEPT